MSRLAQHSLTRQECLGHSQCVDLLRWFLAAFWAVQWFELCRRLAGSDFSVSFQSYDGVLPDQMELAASVLGSLCLLCGIGFMKQRVRLGLVLCTIGLLGSQTQETGWYFGGLRQAALGQPALPWFRHLHYGCLYLYKVIPSFVMCLVLILTLRRLRHDSPG